jgi:hypothetical protein
VKQTSSTCSGPSQAPDFKQIRKYLRTNQQREALGGFIEAGWTPAELGEFARQVFLAPGKTYPTAASYKYAMEKGADHPFAIETLASLRAPSFTMPPFDRPRREAAWHAQPWPVEDQPIPRSLWKRLYKLRIRYHSLEDTLHIQGLSGYREPCTEDTRN